MVTILRNSLAWRPGRFRADQQPRQMLALPLLAVSALLALAGLVDMHGLMVGLGSIGVYAALSLLIPREVN